MNFTDWVQKHRRSILFMVVLLIVGGAGAGLKLPVSLFPHVAFPRLRVMVNAGDRPARQMELQVTRPVEEAVHAVPGVRSVRSTTSRGSTEIHIDFNWGYNMVTALLQTESAVSQIMSRLPKGATYNVRRMRPTGYPVIAYSLTSKTKSQVAVRDFAKYQLVPLLSSVNGVAKVAVQGGQIEEYRVTVEPARLQAFNLSVSDVAKALSASNVLTAVGRVQDHDQMYLEVSDTRFHSLNQIKHTILKSGENGQVELEDVAKVTRSTVPRFIKTTADGQPAVLMPIYQQPGANLLNVRKGLKQAFASFQNKIPKGIKIHQWYDQGQLVKVSEHSVVSAIVLGVLLAAAVLLVFLRSLRITLIAIIAVPAVLAATMLLLYVFHMSLNIMTLGGMAAAVGLIIDDVIVMVEQIIRQVQISGRHHTQQILGAAREFTQPLTGSSASTIIIFLPLAFLSGVTGAFFKALSLTMAGSLIISYLVAWLAIPLLADFLITERLARHKEGRIERTVLRHYRKLLIRFLRRPVWILAIVAPLLVVGGVALKHVGTGFLPHLDEGGFTLDYRAAPGTSLKETNRLLKQVGQILMANPYVDTYSRRTGLQLGGGITEVDTGDFFVRLKQPPRPSTSQVMAQVRKEIHAKVPGLKIDLSQLLEDEIGDLTSVPQPIEIQLYGDNVQALRKLARKVAPAISKIRGVVGVKNGITVAGDSLDIRVNRRKAAMEGVDPGKVTKELNNYLSGDVTTKVRQGVKFVGVRVWIPKKMRDNTSKLGNLLLRAPDGHLFPLKRIATIKVINGQPQITRDHLKTMVAVTGRISGRSLGKTISDVKKVLNKPGMIPKSDYYHLGGLYRQQQKAFKGLMVVFAAAVALEFFLLLFVYESFRTAISIVLAPLASVTAVFIGLWMTGVELNITAMMGMTMIIGIVAEIAIFYFSEMGLLQKQGQRSMARLLLRAGANRLRPIVMTTVAFILALVPLAMGIGQGSGMQQPLAIAIISGLLVQMPLVLLCMPVWYALLMRLQRRSRRMLPSHP